MPSLRLNAVANGPNFADLSASLSGAIARLRDLLRNVPTRVYGKIHIAFFRRDLTQAASNASEIARFARDYDLKYWRPWVLFLEGLAKSESGALAGGLEDMRSGAKRILQNGPLFVPLSNLALGQVEAQAGDLERAIAILEEALV